MNLLALLLLLLLLQQRTLTLALKQARESGTRTYYDGHNTQFTGLPDRVDGVFLNCRHLRHFSKGSVHQVLRFPVLVRLSSLALAAQLFRLKECLISSLRARGNYHI